MKASELILLLQQTIVIHGDREITCAGVASRVWQIETARDGETHIDFTS
jgi:hypothetical protein